MIRAEAGSPDTRADRTMSATDAWSAGDFELADKLRHEQVMQDAIRAELETHARRVQGALKGRSVGERQG